MQRVRAVVPALAEAHAVAADRVEAEAVDETGGDLEPGGEHQEVEGELGAVDDGAGGGHLAHPATVGVDEVHVGEVERLEVLVVEADALAVLAVPGLQLLGGLGILDDLVDPPAEALHDLEVDRLELAPLLVGGRLALGVLAQHLPPAVPDQVAIGLLAGDDRGEVAGALGLPARRQRPEPRLVDGLLPADTDRRRRALEDVDLLRGPSELRDDLHRGGARADDADDLVGEPVHRVGGAPAGVRVVPAGRVEGLAGEAVDAVDARQLRLVHQAARRDEELRADPVAPLRRDVPPVRGVVPLERFDLGLEERVLVEPEVLAEQLAVTEDLGRARVLLGRHVAGLLEQRQVDRGVHVAHAAGVAVPVPRAAEVGRLLDDPEAGDAAAHEVDAREHPREPAAEDDHVDVLDDRVADVVGVGPGVAVEVVLLQALVLGQALVSQSLGALGLVARLGGFDRRRIGPGHGRASGRGSSVRRLNVRPDGSSGPAATP